METCLPTPVITLSIPQPVRLWISSKWKQPQTLGHRYILKQLPTFLKRRSFTTHTTLYTQHFSTLKQAWLPASCHFSSLYRRYMSCRDFLFKLRPRFQLSYLSHCFILCLSHNIFSGFLSLLNFMKGALFGYGMSDSISLAQIAASLFAFSKGWPRPASSWIASTMPWPPSNTSQITVRCFTTWSFWPTFLRKSFIRQMFSIGWTSRDGIIIGWRNRLSASSPSGSGQSQAQILTSGLILCLCWAARPSPAADKNWVGVGVTTPPPTKNTIRAVFDIRRFGWLQPLTFSMMPPNTFDIYSRLPAYHQSTITEVTHL